MTTVITPPIGSKGTFSLAAPFDRLADGGVEYTCMEVRKLSGYLASNENPEELIYKKYGIEDRYKDDMAKDAYIVSLQSRRGHWLYVPEDFILNLPAGSGHRYRAVSLAVSMPPLPSATDFTILKEDIIQLIKARLGVNAKVALVETSLTTLVSDERHIEVSTSRDLSKTSNGNWEELLLLRGQNEELRMKLSQLEEYITLHHA